MSETNTFSNTKDDWQPDTRPVPPELANPKQHADYTPRIEWVSVQEKLDSASKGLLLAFSKGVI